MLSFGKNNKNTCKQRHCTFECSAQQKKKEQSLLSAQMVKECVFLQANEGCWQKSHELNEKLYRSFYTCMRSCRNAHLTFIKSTMSARRTTDPAESARRGEGRGRGAPLSLCGLIRCSILPWPSSTAVFLWPTRRRDRDDANAPSRPARESRLHRKPQRRLPR